MPLTASASLLATVNLIEYKINRSEQGAGNKTTRLRAPPGSDPSARLQVVSILCSMTLQRDAPLDTRLSQQHREADLMAGISLDVQLRVLINRLLKAVSAGGVEEAKPPTFTPSAISTSCQLCYSEEKKSFQRRSEREQKPGELPETITQLEEKMFQTIKQRE
ncbi:hypothetical protein Q7C36_019728 [Tachysurus vachellii]|uniref:Uncharacterized protein n=1 Tax=Tachysurus vachellii TaxID=175792 RepID=A0AA88S4Q3_TACVA|nr:hypothetical protein Q7C36_019728 [Tachysurus vachellii]